MKGTISFKKKINKIISCLLAALMVVTISNNANILVNAGGKEEKKEYIIVTESTEKFKGLVDELDGEVIAEEDSTTFDNNYFTAELSESEAITLARDNDIIVEEDFMLNANEKKEGSKAKEDLYKNLKKAEKAEEKARNNAEPEWNLKAINADEINVNAEGKKKVKVAVLDSGVDIVNGIDLIESINLVDEEKYMPLMFLDLTGHGTHIASVIAGNDENWVQGVNPKVDLYSVKVLNENNAAPISRIIEGIYWCIENKINIINMSFGTSKYSHALKKAVEDAYAANILMVGAAGNNDNEIEYPAAFQEVMAVAATNTKSEISSFSNTGDELDVAAPGEKVKVTGFFGYTGVTHGTSIAAPQVVGVASLLWEKDLSKTNEFIRQLISKSAKPIGNTDDCGLLDAQFAIENYDAFSDGFIDDGLSNENLIPENLEEVESYEYINDNETYVEGRWSSSVHRDMTQSGAASMGVTNADRINLMKKGIAYTDSDSDLFSRRDIYHGGSEDGVISGNYIACYEFVTRIALKNGDSDSISRSTVWGLNSTQYEKIQYDINSTWVGLERWSTYLPSIGYSNNAANRRSFVWGIALHIISDSFAHATREKNSSGVVGALIQKPNSDNISPSRKYGPSRYKVAKKAVEGSIGSLTSGLYGDWMDYAYGLTAYENDFAKVKLKTLAIQNNGGTAVGNPINKASCND